MILKSQEKNEPDSARDQRLFDENEVRKTLKTLFSDSKVIEVRVLNGVFKGGNPNYSLTLSGYFDNPDAVIDGLSKLQAAKGIYVTLNEINPELAGRSYNKLSKGINATGDKDIVRRHFLPIDVDPVRPSGTSASDEAKQKASKVAGDVFSYTQQLGWPTPICADSGNGFHLLYRIDEPSDDNGLILNSIKALADRFDTPEVKLDLQVANPARIVRLYGTRACKGSEVVSQQIYHRMSRIIGGAV